MKKIIAAGARARFLRRKVLSLHLVDHPRGKVITNKNSTMIWNVTQHKWVEADQQDNQSVVPTMHICIIDQYLEDAAKELNNA